MLANPLPALFLSSFALDSTERIGLPKLQHVMPRLVHEILAWHCSRLVCIVMGGLLRVSEKTVCKDELKSPLRRVQLVRKLDPFEFRSGYKHVLSRAPKQPAKPKTVISKRSFHRPYQTTLNPPSTLTVPTWYPYSTHMPPLQYPHSNPFRRNPVLKGSSDPDPQKGGLVGEAGR